MAISPTTFERSIHELFLDLLHKQWCAMGIPLNVRQSHPNEVIDPDALLWASLEFFPTQPRLLEQVLAWRATFAGSLSFHRLRKFATANADPRALIFNEIDRLLFPWQSISSQKKKLPASLPTKPCYGLSSMEELQAFCAGLDKHLRKYVSRQTSPRNKPGKPESTCATIILRARHVLDTDAKHFILVYLLANPGGARLQSIAQWAGQTYQNLAKTAKHWEAANVISMEHGYARLKKPANWADILGLKQTPQQPIVLVNWPRFFDACVTLLRYLAAAAAKSLPADGPVVTRVISKAAEKIDDSVVSDAPSPTVGDFVNILLDHLEKNFTWK